MFVGIFHGGKRNTVYIAFSSEAISTQLTFSHNGNQTNVIQFSITQMQYLYSGKIKIQNP